MKHGKRISKGTLLVCGVCLVLAAGVIFVISFFGKKETSMKEWICAAPISEALYGDKGLFDYGDKGIVYIDAKTRKETPICQKIGCQHKKNEGCDGWIGGMFPIVVSFDGEYLYCLGNEDEDDMDSLDLIRCNPDGTNRVILHTFREMQSATAACCRDGRLYVAYRNSTDLKAREEKINVEAGIRVYDFERDTEKTLYHSTSVDNNITSLDVRDGMVCFSHTFCDLSEKEIIEKKEDVKLKHTFTYLEWLKGKEKRILSKKPTSAILGVAMGKDVIVFSDEKGIEKYNIETQKTECIYAGSQTNMIRAIGLDDVAFFAVSDDKTQKNTYYQMENFGKPQKMGTSSDLIFWMSKDSIYGMDKDGMVYRKNDLAKIAGS